MCTAAVATSTFNFFRPTTTRSCTYTSAAARALLRLHNRGDAQQHLHLRFAVRDESTRSYPRPNKKYPAAVVGQEVGANRRHGMCHRRPVTRRHRLQLLLCTYDTGCLHVQPPTTRIPRHGLTLRISSPPAFCLASCARSCCYHPPPWKRTGSQRKLFLWFSESTPQEEAAPKNRLYGIQQSKSSIINRIARNVRGSEIGQNPWISIRPTLTDS